MKTKNKIERTILWIGVTLGFLGCFCTSESMLGQMAVSGISMASLAFCSRRLVKRGYIPEEEV